MENKDFLPLFFSLSRSKRKVLRFMQWCCKKYDAVYVSHAYIAEKLEFSREFICRTLKQFLQLKWIEWKKRSYNTNIYFMKEWLVKLDLSNVTNHMSAHRQTITQSITPNLFNPLKERHSTANAEPVYQPQGRAVVEALKSLGCSDLLAINLCKPISLLMTQQVLPRFERADPKKVYNLEAYSYIVFANASEAFGSGVRKKRSRNCRVY